MTTSRTSLRAQRRRLSNARRCIDKWPGALRQLERDVCREERRRTSKTRARQRE